MSAVDDSAEKEASEVLHTLLSVERIEKQEDVVENQTYQTSTSADGQEEAHIQWHTPVSISHSLFSAIDASGHFTHNLDEQQVVIWEGHTIVDPESNINTIYTGHSIEESETGDESPKGPENEIKKENPKAKKKITVKKKKKIVNGVPNDPTKIEESAAQVKDRFKRGCECQDESCFRGLNAESVYKHRLNIAELTKGEHDMYLMGVTMACLANPDTTVRHKERRRLRAQYVYQGRRVCLDAFLYLENCTHYQLKRIRKHVMTHGVAPRVHGNHGKKPHNTFSLDIYRHATEFLKQYLEQHTGEKDIVNTKQPIQLPWDVTRKNLHDSYKEYGQILEPGIKLMGYSTFRHFMKEQFPHVKFCKVEPKSCTPHHSTNQNTTHSSNQQQQQTPQVQTVTQNQQIQTVIERPREQQIQVQKCVITNEVQQVIPLVVAPSPTDTANAQHHQQTFLVTPVPQLVPNANVVTPQHTNNHTTTNTFSYQLANTGYVINEQGNLVTTMANAQHHTPYTFGRM
ncbi:uncharacterized protein LOC126878467 isoform X1 [Diabrotica virgifera virgifera]|uniref:Uncharacterized protein LOC114344534 isoform X1 n=1 Tax=Diabrotica virgifera virgifera TaxID=50390 RepID=A0A6P7GYG9_DIAVI|nr:uncharacterized protein LOC126878467 isoform X1 [Diabrotica virgifera virgifera]XP_050497167.1 uncharacterized protein LOC126878467 isoform X1 [Diabrotica virgifera virgifera]